MMCAGFLARPLRWRFLVVAALLLGFACPPRAAQRVAILVGVSAYPRASGLPALTGVRNDLALVRNALMKHGFARERITLVADGVEGATLAPTRENILATLRGRARDARPGDFYFLYMAGHGSQAPLDPALPRRKPNPDELSEIFLPIDVGRWSDTPGRVERAIYDEELVEILDEFLARGAFVWAAFDACHSASILRGGAPAGDVAVRGVAPELLGLPPSARTVSTHAVASATDRPRNGGGFVAFYAADANDVAIEMKLPAGPGVRESDRAMYGIFTYTLVEAMTARPGATYRQLAQFVSSRLGAQFFAQAPTPVFSGTSLDAVAFGAEPAAPVKQWPIVLDRARDSARASIAAGTLAQIGDGALFAVVPDALARSGDVLGYVEADQPSAFASALRPAKGTGAPLSPARLPAGAYARLLRPALDFTLRVAECEFASGTPAQARTVVERALAPLESAALEGIALAWQAPAGAADVYLRYEDGRLWLMPASGSLVRASAAHVPSIAVDAASEGAGITDALRGALTRIARALNVLRLADALGARAPDSPVTVKLDLVRKGAADVPLDVESALARPLAPGDRIRWQVRNGGRVPVDVSLLYIDAAFGIEPIFPGPKGDTNRVPPAGVLASRAGVDEIVLDDRTAGTERLLVIVTEARPGLAAVDYRWLAQPDLLTRRDAGARAASPFDVLLEAAAFGSGALRGGASTTASIDAMLRVYTFNVAGRTAAVNTKKEQR